MNRMMHEYQCGCSCHKEGRIPARALYGEFTRRDGTLSGIYKERISGSDKG